MAPFVLEGFLLAGTDNDHQVSWIAVKLLPRDPYLRSLSFEGTRGLCLYPELVIPLWMDSLYHDQYVGLGFYLLMEVHVWL